MIPLAVFVLSNLIRIQGSTVTSPQIRILDVATKASETRLIPNRVDYPNSFHPHFQQQNRYDQNNGPPLKSYVIYDEYPVKIFKEWKANPPTEFSPSAPQNYLDLNRQPNVEFPPVYYFRNGQQILPAPKPTLAYSSVYSNVIKVFEDSLNSLDRNRFQSEKYIKPFEGNIWKSQPPGEYESLYPQEIPRRQMYNNFKLPENFPKVFSPNDKFHFPSFDDGIRQPPRIFYPQEGYYDTYTINYNRENTRHRDEVEILPEVVKQKTTKKPFLCSFIRVNQRQFPENGSPCARSDDDLPLIPPEYPDYSNLPNDKIPVEHRRQHFQIKRIKRSEMNESFESRQKREAGFGYGYSGWGSPFNYESEYFSDSYPSRESYRNEYRNNRNRNQNYRSKYYSGSRYDDYDDDYQSNDDSGSRGLSGYLTNGGRRYKNRKNNDDDDDDYDDNNNNNDNNRDNDSDEEMERMNRRDASDRRNNEDSRDRRRNNNNNNNNNDDDDYRDNRRNNNRNNRRNNNRRNNDRYDNNSNRNRYYSSSNGYSSNNGYGSSYGGYGSNYGGYGSGGYGSGGYGSGGYGSGGYGSGYGSNGGYGYGGYGNGFGSF